MMKVLETSRLILRELRQDDADDLARVISDPETMRFYPAPYDEAGVEQWIARNRQRYADNGHGLWAMVLKTSGEMIGDCGLTVQRVDGVGEIEIGYHLRRDLWGRGFASEGAAASRDWGFANLPVEWLISLIRPENFPSRRVAERVGLSLWRHTIHAGLPHLVYGIRRNAGTQGPNG